LIGTKSHALTFGSEQRGLEGYADANDGSSQEHQHAISGYAYLMDGGAISWISRKQEVIALSTTEAEYIATTHGAKEAIWFQKLLGELFPGPSKTFTLSCDNQSTINLATTDNYHARTKHIDVRYHFIRELITNGTIQLKYCPTNSMVADILAKPVPVWKVPILAHDLGLHNVCKGV